MAQAARPKRNAMLSRRPGFYSDIKNRDGADLVRLTRTKEFNVLQDIAYNSHAGYDIKMINGQKVMYVSGSRNKTDWALNVIDGFLPSKFHVLSKNTSKNLSEIAKKNNVDVVIGHSRGAKLVADMDKGPYQKMGLDGAMMLATKDRDMINVAEKQPLDRLIGLRGKNNYWVKASKDPRKWHFVSRNYKGYKPPGRNAAQRGGGGPNPKRDAKVAWKFTKRYGKRSYKPIKRAAKAYAWKTVKSRFYN